MMKFPGILKLLVLVGVVFGISRIAGWYFARRPVVEAQRKVAKSLEAFGAHYYYDFQLQEDESLADWEAGDVSKLGWAARWLGSPDWTQDLFYVTFAKFDTVEEQGGIATRRDDVGDQQLAPLFELKGLKWLALNGTSVTDAAVARLAAQGEMQRLWAAQTAVSDLTAAALKMCPRLEHLSIEGTLVSDRGLAVLGELKSLKVLAVGSHLLSADGLSQVGSAEGLQKLYMETPRANDSVLRSLSHLSNLQFLSLRRAQVSAAGLRWLGELENLRHVQLDGTPVGDDAISVAANWHKLQHLSLGGCPVTDRGISELRSCRELKSIVLDGTQCSLTGVLDLFRGHLQYSTEEALKCTFETTQYESGRLRSVDFGGLEICDEDVAEINLLTELQWLEMPRNRLTALGLEKLANGRLAKLTLLRIDGANVSAEAIRRLAALPSLRNLHAVGCGLSPDLVKQIRSEFPSLRIYTDKLKR